MFTQKEQRQIRLTLDIIKSNIPSKRIEGIKRMEKHWPELLSQSDKETWYGWWNGNEFCVSCHKALWGNTSLSYSSRTNNISVYEKTGTNIKWIADETDCDFLAECVK